MRMPKWRWLSQRVQEWREEAHEHVGDGVRWRVILLALAVVLVLLSALGVYWSREPAPFDVADSVGSVLNEPGARPAAGATTAATLVRIVGTLLDKPGGFINNDIAPPGIWLDDMPSWERGVLRQAHDMALALRDDFGKPATGNEPDEDLARAETRLNFSDHSWMLPSSEAQYRDARGYLRDYLKRLQGGSGKAPGARFSATAASLESYLARVTARLDASVRRLSACVAPRENPLLQHIASAPVAAATTPSSEIDDVFYEARGSAWALLHLLRAIDHDFAAVLRERGAEQALHEAIRDLDATQDTIYSPIILNGSGFGLVANHSLVMASYMARADTAVTEVRRLLTSAAGGAGAEGAPATTALPASAGAAPPPDTAAAPVSTTTTEQEAKP